MKEKLKAFQQYLSLEKRYSKHTLLSYQTDLDQLCTFLQNQYELNSWEEVEPVFLRSWLAELVGDGLTEATIRRKISSVRSFFRFLERRYGYTTGHAKVLTLPKLPQRLPTVVREKELEFLFETVAFPDSYDGHRDRTILELFYTGGLRRAELIGITLDDLDFERMTIRIKGKGNKVRMLPLTRYMRGFLEHYLQVRADHWQGVSERALFLTAKGKPLYPKAVYRIVNRYLSVVSNEKKRSPHVLRHSFATHLTDSGADINAVKELLGHSSLAATQIYTHNSIEKLKKSYLQAHPKARKTKGE